MFEPSVDLFLPYNQLHGVLVFTKYGPQFIQPLHTLFCLRLQGAGGSQQLPEAAFNLFIGNGHLNAVVTTPSYQIFKKGDCLTCSLAYFPQPLSLPALTLT